MKKISLMVLMLVLLPLCGVHAAQFTILADQSAAELHVISTGIPSDGYFVSFLDPEFVGDVDSFNHPNFGGMSYMVTLTEEVKQQLIDELGDRTFGIWDAIGYKSITFNEDGDDRGGRILKIVAIDSPFYDWND